MLEDDENALLLRSRRAYASPLGVAAEAGFSLLTELVTELVTAMQS